MTESDTLWTAIAASFKSEPRDVATVPLQGDKEKWFYVFEKNGEIFIETGRYHANKSKISRQRKLDKTVTQEIYKLYLQRKKGVAVSGDAMQMTRNSSYWYGIFASMGW